MDPVLFLVVFRRRRSPNLIFLLKLGHTDLGISTEFVGFILHSLVPSEVYCLGLIFNILKFSRAH